MKKTDRELEIRKELRRLKERSGTGEQVEALLQELADIHTPKEEKPKAKKAQVKKAIAKNPRAKKKSSLKKFSEKVKKALKADEYDGDDLKNLPE